METENHKLRIVFFGTPEFAKESLYHLVKNKLNIIAVVTAPDRRSGRGLKPQPSAVKQFAVKNNIKVLQPANLKSEEFINDLNKLNPDLQVVVAFRMLPRVVWDLPKNGTINLHASLLPEYRGAAPINWALINGEKETGLTTFFIRQKIDTGNVIDQVKTPILSHYNAGDLHDLLMKEGGKLLVRTIDKITRQDFKEIPQDQLNNSKNLKEAPKLSKENTRINWKQKSELINNHIKGLSPYPTAWTELTITDDKRVIVKIYEASFELVEDAIEEGRIKTDGKKFIKVKTNDGYIYLHSLQLPGKKRMKTEDFLRGFTFNKEFRLN